MDQHLKAIAKLDQRLDGYLLGLKYGITLADLDYQCKAQLKEIEDMRAQLKERNGKASQPKVLNRPAIFIGKYTRVFRDFRQFLRKHGYGKESRTQDYERS